MNKRRQALLEALLSQPTAPFREQRVIDFATDVLRHAGVPWFRDPVGNIVVGVASAQAYRQRLRQKTAEPVRLFIAHMDHPGFHGVTWRSATRLAVRWHGGSPIRHLRGARVWLAGEDGWTGDGRIGKVKLRRDRRALATAEIVLTVPAPRPPAASLYGGLRFRAPVWRQGRRLYTQAADDLVGVFALLVTALDAFGARRSRKSPPFIGLLTRAEEVGFVGAVAHFDLGWLATARRPVVYVSLEASRTLPGAIVGQGPVVRLGDRRTVFDATGLRVLSKLAEHVLPGRHQRRIMDGGTCEATAAIAWGLPAIGISVPLGNYHNESFEGGPSSRGPRGPAPEFVHLDDVDGMAKLCAALMRPKLPWSDAWGGLRKRLRGNLRSYRRLLKRGV